MVAYPAQYGASGIMTFVVNHDGIVLDSAPDLMTAVAEADCVAIITNHSDYDYDAILDAAQMLVDTRNALGAKGKASPKVVRL